jgi:hypothetical protein
MSVSAAGGLAALFSSRATLTNMDFAPLSALFSMAGPLSITLSSLKKIKTLHRGYGLAPLIFSSSGREFLALAGRYG